LEALHSPELSVDFQDGLLRIEATQRSWTEVLDAIRDRTGIRFHVYAPLTGGVTVSVPGLPVQHALKRLFAPEANLVFRYRESALRPSAPPQDVWVLGTGRDDAPEALQTTSDSGQKTRGSQAAVPFLISGSAIERGQDTGAAAAEDAQNQLDLHDPLVIDHLVEMAHNADPATRVWALSHLVGSGPEHDGSVEVALDAALTDSDAGVRGFAVQASASRSGPEAMAHLWYAVRDPDPEVRMRAIDSVVPANEQGMALLQAALADADETVRSLAAFRLQSEMHAPSQ
jgi:hypothetical protein